MDENGFGKIGENMKSMLHNEEASARSDAGIVAMSMFFAGLLIVAFTTSPIASGTQVGERAPIFQVRLTMERVGNPLNLMISWTSLDLEFNE